MIIIRPFIQNCISEGLGLLKTGSLSLSLSLSLYSFHPSIPFTSLSLSPLYPFHLSIPFTSLSLSPLSLSLSLLSLPPSLYLSFYLSFFLSLSLLLSLFSISFSLEYLMDVFVLVIRWSWTSNLGHFIFSLISFSLKFDIIQTLYEW